MKSKFYNFFPPIGLNFFFLAFPDLQDYEMTNDKNVCESVSLWFCNKNKSGFVSIPEYFQICTKFGTFFH